MTLSRLWKQTKEVATIYIVTFVVVMVLNQLVFFGFCLNPVCLIAAMPHVLLITAVFGTWVIKSGTKNNDSDAGRNHYLPKNLDVGEEELNPVDSAEQRSKQNIVLTGLSILEESLDELNHNLSKKLEETRKSRALSEKAQSKPVGAVARHDSRLPSTPPSSRKCIEDSVFDAPSEFATESARELPLVGNEYEEPYLDSTGLTSTEDFWSEGPPTWMEDIPPWSDNDFSAYCEMPSEQLDFSFINELSLHGIHSIWHVTHIENLSGILEKGILSNSLAYEVARPVDISDHAAQKWRIAKETQYGRRINEYAPTYLSIRNPMLFVRRAMQNELCLIEISLAALLDHEFIFTDGNAAAKETKFYKSVCDLSRMPWDVLHSDYWSAYPDGKRKKCAEILIHPSIGPRHIKTIRCFSDEALIALSGIGVQVMKSRELFFANSNKFGRSDNNANFGPSSDSEFDDIPF